MKPCECNQEVKVKKLQEQGIRYNDYSLTVDSSGVYIGIEPHIIVHIHHSRFYSFAKWYLTNQPEKG